MSDQRLRNALSEAVRSCISWASTPVAHTQQLRDQEHWMDVALEELDDALDERVRQIVDERQRVDGA